MEKKFNMKEDHLEVVATQSDEIFLPSENGKKVIGTYDQTTIQKIDKDKANDLLEFIESEVGKAENQLKLINKQLEPLKDLESIDQSVVDACKNQINKGTKVFKQKMLVLNEHLDNLNKRRNLKLQSEYVEKQLEQMYKERDDLKSVL